MLKVFGIVRNDHIGYDEYDSAVVVAETADEALELLKEEYDWGWGDWDVTVEEVQLTEPKIVLESYNAG